jgi:hypothetical protein
MVTKLIRWKNSFAQLASEENERREKKALWVCSLIGNFIDSRHFHFFLLDSPYPIYLRPGQSPAGVLSDDASARIWHFCWALLGCHR